MLKRLLTIVVSVVLLLCSISGGFAQENASLYENFIYGTSVQGRLLLCHRIGDPQAAKSFLMVFGIHGFEDSFKRDGAVLSQIANLIIDHYRANPALLGDNVLYIVPCANPDGQEAGTSQDGFGRCNADGIDINRDFPVGWKKMSTARYKTGAEPFSTAEAKALRYLVQTLSPTYGADVHGWINRAYGDPALAQPFMDAFGFKYHEYKSGGMLSQWMAEEMEAAVLIELPDNARADGFAEDCAAKLIQALNSWFGTDTAQGS